MGEAGERQGRGSEEVWMGGIEQAVEGRSPWGTLQSPGPPGTEEPAVGSRVG